MSYFYDPLDAYLMAPKPAATTPFMVARSGGGAPTVQHRTRALAELEAQRLANQNPGAVFYVLGAVSVVSAPKPNATVRKLA
jgi:hypothetical protein